VLLLPGLGYEHDEHDGRDAPALLRGIEGTLRRMHGELWIARYSRAATRIEDIAAGVWHTLLANTAGLSNTPTPVFLIGHSMGGVVAQVMATQFQSQVASRFRIAGVALLATGPGCSRTRVSPRIVLAYCATAARAVLGGHARRDTPLGVRYRHMLALLRFLLARKRACDARAAVLQHVPMWIGHGARDAVVPVANARVLQDMYPHATAVIYPNDGHALITPDVVADVDRWMRGVAL